MQKLLGAAALAGVALFMLVGFLNADVSGSAAAALAALGLVVGLPAVGSALLLRSHLREGDRRRSRKAELRERTLESEILRLAGTRGGRLTAVEVATELTMRPDEAKEALDALALRSQADFEVTDAGVIVYSFHDLRHLGGKHSARGILDG